MYLLVYHFDKNFLCRKAFTETTLSINPPVVMLDVDWLDSVTVTIPLFPPLVPMETDREERFATSVRAVRRVVTSLTETVEDCVGIPVVVE